MTVACVSLGAVAPPEASCEAAGASLDDEEDGGCLELFCGRAATFCLASSSRRALSAAASACSFFSLAAIDKLCFFSCAEFRDLRQAIADYKRTRK